jgi:hypothetical protein
MSDKHDEILALRFFILRAKMQKFRVGIYINGLCLGFLTYVLMVINVLNVLESQLFCLI